MSFGNSSTLGLSFISPHGENARVGFWPEWHPANFEAVIEQHQTRLYRFIYAMVGDAELAQDLTQDTFLLAYRHLQKRTQTQTQTRSFTLFEDEQPQNQDYPAQFNMTAWLYTIARNTTLTELKRRKKFKFSFSGSWNSYSGHGQGRCQDENQDPLDKTEDRHGEDPGDWLDLKDELQRVIQRVGPNKIMPLLLFLDGFSYLEICQITGDSLANVKVKIFRAKALLRQALATF